MNKNFRSKLTSVRKYLFEHFAILLIFTVLISYGQMLKMNVWQDDQALFFKLAHIQEEAGFFGPGPFGAGVYRFEATPFIPIYHVFGFNTTAYFAYLLLLYIFSALVVFKTFSILMGKAAGRVAGFIYAAGYITSDGVWRMANSSVTSISIILVCLCVICYWNFYKKGKLIWYSGALILYLAMAEIAVARAHYVFALIISFELIFLAFTQSYKSVVNSLIRLIPFGLIFYKFFIEAADVRAGSAKDFILAAFHGQISQYYGFLGSLTNLVLPDWLTSYLLKIQISLDSVIKTPIPFLRIMAIILPSTFIFILFMRHKARQLLIPLFILLLIAWSFLSKSAFLIAILSPTREQLFITILGGALLMSFVAIFISIKHKKMFLFLTLWMLLNMAAYSGYNPTVIYETINRYLSHSFLALAGIYGLLFSTLNRKELLGKVGVGFIIFIALGNIYSGVSYQNVILQSRSNPTRDFFVQVQKDLPKINQGDIVYIEVSPNEQGVYNDAISAAMMPDTTSFAWRYGIDRYDFKLVNDFPSLLETIPQNNSYSTQVHTFWYSKNGLIDTTDEIRKYLSGRVNRSDVKADFPLESNAKLEKTPYGSKIIQNDISIELNKPLTGAIPQKLTLSITASPLTGNLSFPLMKDSSNVGSIYKDPQLRSKALTYKAAKSNFYDQAVFKVSSEWKDRNSKNLHDQDPNTVWQVDRTLWGNSGSFVEIELPTVENIDKLIWINGFPNNTPTNYLIKVSTDGLNWQTVKSVNYIRKIESTLPQVDSFNRVNAKFVKMEFYATISGDSPSLAEMWIIPYEASQLDIPQAEEFIQDPFKYVPAKDDFDSSLSYLNNIGLAQLYWQNNETDNFQAIKPTQFNIIYDNQPHQYTLTIPPGGTQIKRLKISDLMIPGQVRIDGIKIY